CDLGLDGGALLVSLSLTLEVLVAAQGAGGFLGSSLPVVGLRSHGEILSLAFVRARISFFVHPGVGAESSPASSMARGFIRSSGSGRRRSSRARTRSGRQPRSRAGSVRRRNAPLRRELRQGRSPCEGCS